MKLWNKKFATKPKSDLLNRNQALGRHLANSLGDHALVLMRGHEATVVGASLEVAVFRAIYAEFNARVQTTAHSLDPITCLNEDVSDAAETANSGQIGRAWSFWALRAQRNVASLLAEDQQ